MNALTTRFIGTGLLFIFIFLSGVWLSNSGRPLNTIILTIHKLIALAALGLIGYTVYQAYQTAPLSGVTIIAVIITGGLFVLTIITGGLLSLDGPVTSLAIVHKIGPFLTVASTAVTLYLMTHQPS